MVDPNKLKDFLQRTAAALQKSMDSGDAEGTNRFSSMLDRAVPLAEKVTAPPAMPQQAASATPSQDAVIPWGTKMPAPQEAPQFDPTAKQTAPSLGQALNTPKPAPLLSMPGGQEVPLGSKGTPPKQGESSFNKVGKFITELPIVKQNVQLGGAMKDAATSPVGQELARRGALGVPGMAAVGAWDMMGKKEKDLNLPSSEVSALPPEGKEDYGLPTDNSVQPLEPEMQDVVQQVEANPYDDVEAEAIKRIKNELQGKTHPLTYLFTLLMMGAPRTFAMIMSDQNRYSQGVRDIYNSVRADKANWARNKTSQGFREREVGANEDRALASMARAENDKLRAQQGEQGKDLRTIMQAPIDPNDALAQRARELMMLRLPPGAK